MGRLAGTQIETGVMPGTADALALDDAIGKRTVIVAAMRVDGENLVACAHQQHFVVADMSEQHRAREFGRRDAFGQIGTGG